jgi:hypothetical protein
MKLEQPDEVAAAVTHLMGGFGRLWCLAGGWALDLFLGGVTRAHGDVELAIFREDQSRLHGHFNGWRFTTSLNRVRTPWLDGEVLELPIHEIHAYSADEPPTSIEFLLNERDQDNWVYRRDRTIVLPLERAVLSTAFGVDVLSPEIVLLFKSKQPRPKDEADFETALPRLDDDQISWLCSALRTSDPAHPWIQRIDKR